MGHHQDDGRVLKNEMPPMPPPDPWNWQEVKARLPQLLNVTIEGEVPGGKNASLGFFKDDRGADYLLVTNLWHDRGMSETQCSQTVTLIFASVLKWLTRLSRKTGLPERLVVCDSRLKLRLPSGPGDLFKLNNGEWPARDGRR